MSKSNSKLPMAQVLKQELYKRGFTLVRASETLSIRPGTLRAWIGRNRFPEQDLLRLTELAGLPVDLEELQRQYLFQAHTRKC